MKIIITISLLSFILNINAIAQESTLDYIVVLKNSEYNSTSVAYALLDQKTVQATQVTEKELYEHWPDIECDPYSIHFLFTKKDSFLLSINGNLDQNARRLVNPSKEELTKLITKLSFSQVMASAIASIYPQTAAYLASDGTMFLGTKDDIKKGYYGVIGRNSFGNQQDTLGYLIRYKDGEAERVDLSDNRILLFSYSPNWTTLSITDYCVDKNFPRLAVQVYQKSDKNTIGYQFTGTKIIFNDLGKAELMYTYKGDLQPISLERLQAGKYTGVKYSLLPEGKGFIISFGNKKEVFTMNGKYYYPETRAEKPYEYRITEDFMATQKIHMNFAQYDNPEGNEVRIYNAIGFHTNTASAVNDTFYFKHTETDLFNTYYSKKEELIPNEYCIKLPNPNDTIPWKNTRIIEAMIFNTNPSGNSQFVLHSQRKMFGLKTPETVETIPWLTILNEKQKNNP
jgi:hypothetical protein